MLHEWEGVRQRSEEGPRRWYVDEAMDLIVWIDGDDVAGFQLCYDKGADEKAFTWRRDGHATHTRVDGGEGRPGTFKSSPVLAEPLPMDTARVADEFSARSEELSPEIRNFVLRRISGV